jgi:hypothetical protein
VVEASEGESRAVVAEALAAFAGFANATLDPGSRMEIAELLTALGAR